MEKSLRKSYVIDGETFVCKIPDVEEQWALQGKLPILPATTVEEVRARVAEIASNPEKSLAMIEYVDRMLLRCGIAPKFIPDSPAEIPEGCQPIKEVKAATRILLYGALMADSGFTVEAAEAIRPTSATDEAY